MLHRASVKAEGFSAAAVDGRPVIGICNSWSELVTLQPAPARARGRRCKRGVLAAGGLPLEFPTISLGENLMKPTTMLFRNLMSMDVEECDPRLPAGRRRAARRLRQDGAGAADGRRQRRRAGDHAHRRARPRRRYFRGRELGAGTDLWQYADEVRAGRMTQAEYDELEAALTSTSPATATSSAPPRPSPRWSRRSAWRCPARPRSRRSTARPRRRGRGDRPRARSSWRASELRAAADPDRRAAFDNAITAADGARGRSTNAVIHLLALAGRVGRATLDLERFDELSRRTPVLANLRPVRRRTCSRTCSAPAACRRVLRELAPLLRHRRLTVTGRTLGEELATRRGRRPRRDRAARGAALARRAGSPCCAATWPRRAP